uniref:C-type lectin domain-containing protein n=1 Tax=Acrobeloides nanus TaxID=290746 RepID=A0A914DLI6_9BILA
MLQFILKLITLIIPVLCACPPNSTVSPSGVCYALYNNSLDWFHAEAACIKEGGNLANIPDAFTNSFISSYAKSILGFQNYWVGGLADSSGNYSYWEWIDYKSFKYTNWAPGQPVYTTPDYCLIQNPADGQWSAVTCDHREPYMCEFSNSSSLCPPSWLHTTAFGGENASDL